MCFSCFSCGGFKKNLKFNKRWIKNTFYQLHNLIDWLNKNHSSGFNKLPLNTNNLENSSWLSGFVDGVGSFHVRIKEKEIEDQGNLLKFVRVACRLRIEHKLFDPCEGSYESIFK